MARTDKFKQVMFSPYFQSDHYRDSKQGQLEIEIEKKIERKINLFKKAFNTLRGKLL